MYCNTMHRVINGKVNRDQLLLRAKNRGPKSRLPSAIRICKDRGKYFHWVIWEAPWQSGILLQNAPCTHCRTQGPQPCSSPSLTHTSSRDSWTLIGKSRSVSCGVTTPFSWVLVCTKFCCASKSLFPQSCESSIIKSHWPPKLNSLGVLSPVAGSTGWKICFGP